MCTWIGHHSLLKVDDLGPKHLFCNIFNEFGVCVCVVGTFVSFLML